MNDIIIARDSQRVRASVRLERSPKGCLDVIVGPLPPEGLDSTDLRLRVDAFLAEAVRVSGPSERVRLILLRAGGAKGAEVRYVYPGSR